MRISDWSSDVCSSDLGPFYAVKIHPGDGSTTVGLRIDPQCRVTDANGDPFEGLYAAGLDANSIWRGKSPAHGCNVGPAMVLGYLAGNSLAEARTRACCHPTQSLHTVPSIHPRRT